MKTAQGINIQTSKPTSAKKSNPRPDAKPKVKLGTGRHLGSISDTLFDEDLKG